MASRIRGAAALLFVVSLLQPVAQGSEEDSATFAKVFELSREGAFDDARELVETWHAASDPPSPARRHELLGLVETYARDFDAAAEHYVNWCLLEPGSHVPSFNLAEVRLLQGQHADAAKEFSVAEGFANELGEEDVVALARFKRVVCALLLGEMHEAKALAEVLESDPPHPARSYSDAAILYIEGGLREAQQILQSNGLRYPPHVNDLYLDTFLELGWAKQRPQNEPLLVPRE